MTTATNPAPTTTQDPARLAAGLVRVDAAATALLGVALLAATRPLASAAGLEDPAPLVGLATVLIVHAILFWRAAAGGPTATVLRVGGAIDLVFAAIVLAVAVVDPWGATATVRWSTAGLADAVLVIGAAKLLLAPRVARSSTARPGMG